MTTILVVDDTPDILLLVRSLLEETGYVAHTATNGTEALALAIEHRPQLIITDWMMPEMDGVALFHAVRSTREIGLTPMILMTAGRPIPDVPVQAILRKPFAISDLFSCIERFALVEG
jgi:CheY-like chemotaxis protein